MLENWFGTELWYSHPKKKKKKANSMYQSWACLHKVRSHYNKWGYSQGSTQRTGASVVGSDLVLFAIVCGSSGVAQPIFLSRKENPCGIKELETYKIIQTNPLQLQTGHNYSILDRLLSSLCSKTFNDRELTTFWGRLFHFCLAKLTIVLLSVSHQIHNNRVLDESVCHDSVGMQKFNCLSYWNSALCISP